MNGRRESKINFVIGVDPQYRAIIDHVKTLGGRQVWNIRH